jgi:hypothetical protein
MRRAQRRGYREDMPDVEGGVERCKLEEETESVRRLWNRYRELGSALPLRAPNIQGAVPSGAVLKFRDKEIGIR